MLPLMRIGQTSLIFFISKVFGSLLGFFATIYFARVLGEEILGFYALTLSVVTWLTLIGNIGFTGAITKRISEGTERKKYATAGATTILVIALVAALGTIIFQDFINSYIGRPVAVYIAIILLASLSTSFAFAVMRGYHLVHIFSILTTTRIGLRALLQVGLVIIGFQLTGLLIGHAVAAILTTVISLSILRLRPVFPQKKHFTSLTNYAKFSWLSNIRGRTFDQFDIIILGFFVQTGLIGVYSVAWSLSKFLDIFSSGISKALFPEMSEIAAQNNAESISGLVEDALAFSGLFIIPGFIGGLILSDRIMRIYGEGFVVGEIMLPILIISLLIYSYNKQLLNTLNAIDRPDLAFRSNAVFIIGNVLLNVVLIWRFGWIGAAVATALSAVMGLIVAFHYVSAKVPFSVPYEEIVRQWTAGLCMGLLVYLVRQFGEINWTWIENYNAAFVVLLVGFGAAVYFSVLLAISSDFRTVVANNLPLKIPFVAK